MSCYDILLESARCHAIFLVYDVMLLVS